LIAEGSAIVVTAIAGQPTDGIRDGSIGWLGDRPIPQNSRHNNVDPLAMMIH
jgi:hypothetical protein